MPKSKRSALCACRWLHLEGQQWDGSTDQGQDVHVAGRDLLGPEHGGATIHSLTPAFRYRAACAGERFAPVLNQEQQTR